jgi:hypothetical protein
MVEPAPVLADRERTRPWVKRLRFGSSSRQKLAAPRTERLGHGHRAVAELALR